MGMHPCKYCYTEQGYIDNPDRVYDPSSTGDITLVFPNGDTFEMPDMILHYVFDHQWLPPREFIADVMAYEASEVETERLQTKGLMMIEPVYMKIAYLEGDYPTGPVSDEFKARLVALIEKAAADYPWMVAPSKKS